MFPVPVPSNVPHSDLIDADAVLPVFMERKAQVATSLAVSGRPQDC